MATVDGEAGETKGNGAVDSVGSLRGGSPAPAPSTLDLGRYVARPMRVSDAPAVFAMLSDPDVVAARSLPPPDDVAGALEWIELALGDPGCVPWAIERRDDGLVVGYVALQGYHASGRVSEVGYLVVPSDRRRGVATRALIAASDWGFTTLGLARISLVHDVDNIGSCAVARAAGFVVEGVLRSSRQRLDGTRVDQELHARLRDDPPLPTESGR